MKNSTDTLIDIIYIAGFIGVFTFSIFTCINNF